MILLRVLYSLLNVLIIGVCMFENRNGKHPCLDITRLWGEGFGLAVRSDSWKLTNNLDSKHLNTTRHKYISSIVHFIK